MEVSVLKVEAVDSSKRNVKLQTFWLVEGLGFSA